MQPVGGRVFYVSLTMGRNLVGAERRFLGTGIGFGATGILGFFPACTSRRRYMYTLAACNVLIINITIKRVETVSLLPSLLYKDTKQKSRLQVRLKCGPVREAAFYAFPRCGCFPLSCRRGGRVRRKSGKKLRYKKEIGKFEAERDAFPHSRPFVVPSLAAGAA